MAKECPAIQITLQLAAQSSEIIVQLLTEYHCYCHSLLISERYATIELYSQVLYNIRIIVSSNFQVRTHTHTHTHTHLFCTHTFAALHWQAPTNQKQLSSLFLSLCSFHVATCNNYMHVLVCSLTCTPLLTHTHRGLDAGNCEHSAKILQLVGRCVDNGNDQVSRNQCGMSNES